MTHSNPARPARVAALAVIALVALVGSGCSKKLMTQLVPNQAPEVRLTAAPLVDDKTRPEFYAYTIQWVGFDPDGRVDHYIYAVDPDSLGFSPTDTAWHATVKNEQTFFFAADTTITGGSPPLPDSRDPRSEDSHTFAVYAVDNQGKISSRPAARSFWSFTQAPFVNISDPIPNSVFGLNLTPSVRITWTGTDPDGQFTTKPVRWVFRLFTKINPDFPTISDFVTFAQLKGDSLRKMYMPGSTVTGVGGKSFADFQGWNKVGADTTSFQYTNLSTNQVENPEYLFVVTGFDEAGAYDPIFETGKNMLRFSVNFASTSGPIIRMFNQFFDYVYPYGGFDESEARWFRVEVPADIPIRFNWMAFPAPGAEISGTRWGLDLIDLDDETARRVESDWRERRWSARTAIAQNFFADIGPFTTNGEFHLFFIEAEDNNHLLSLGIIAFTVVKADWDTARDLLIVDDTRMAPDNQLDGVIQPPVGAWPMAAELDTFLYAKGNFPWKARNPGVLSSPGIFNGYPFDTVGTRGIALDGLVPLSLLVRYKHIVWMVDPAAASYTGAPTDQSTPITALRLVNSPGRPAILSTYMIQGFKTEGGNVWLLGGGAMNATLAPYNHINNGASTYSRELGELQEGRLMFDYAHWREEIQTLPATRANKFAPGAPVPGQGDNRPGRGWPPPPIPAPTPPFAPDYSILPLALNPKGGATDPLPPGREFDPGAFYVGTYSSEYISQPSFVFEDYDDGVNEQFYSTLDTLYLTRGGTAQRDKPVMTYYHGRECQPFVFSGFNIWYWRRPDCIALVDFVVGSVWGIPRDAGAPRGPAVRANRHQASR